MDVSKLDWTNRTETEVELGWVTPEFRSLFTNMTYHFTWIPNGGKSNSTTGNHITISNLTAGQVYKFTLHFNLFDGERWIRYTHERSVSVRTSKYFFTDFTVWIFVVVIVVCV